MSNNKYPLITNSNDYMYIKKYVSIHSEDRDMKKYPNSALFTIEMPQDYVNVVTIKLESWSFPSNYSVFSILNNNITMSFIINNPCVYPDGNSDTASDISQLSYVITHLLLLNTSHIYSIIIDDGFYTPNQMAYELTNKFNEAVTNFIDNFLTQNIGSPVGTVTITQAMVTLFTNYTDGYGGYTDFVIIYHAVSQKLLFGNTNSGFIIPANNSSLTQLSSSVLNTYDYNAKCEFKCLPDYNAKCEFKGLPDYNAKCEFKGLPDYSNYGLVSNLGFSPNINTSIPTNSLKLFYTSSQGAEIWLTPDIEKYPVSSTSTTTFFSYYIEPSYKINLMGPSYIYIDLDELNNIDETSPFDNTYLAETTTSTNSRVNSAFAKIAVSSTPVSQWFDHTCKSFKMYNPPAERIRKLKIRTRYHDGTLAVFGVFNYSFTLEFTMLIPQQLTKINTLYTNMIY